MRLGLRGMGTSSSSDYCSLLLAMIGADRSRTILLSFGRCSAARSGACLILGCNPRGGSKFGPSSLVLGSRWWRRLLRSAFRTAWSLLQARSVRFQFPWRFSSFALFARPRRHGGPRGKRWERMRGGLMESDVGRLPSLTREGVQCATGTSIRGCEPSTTLSTPRRDVPTCSRMVRFRGWPMKYCLGLM